MQPCPPYVCWYNAVWLLSWSNPLRIHSHNGPPGFCQYVPAKPCDSSARQAFHGQSVPCAPGGCWKWALGVCLVAAGRGLMGLEGKEQPLSGPQVSSHSIFRQRKASLSGHRKESYFPWEIPFTHPLKSEYLHRMTMHSLLQNAFSTDPQGKQKLCLKFTFLNSQRFLKFLSAWYQ